MPIPAMLLHWGQSNDVPPIDVRDSVRLLHEAIFLGASRKGLTQEKKEAPINLHNP